MGVLVASNALLLDRADSLRALLNSGVTLRLFVGPSSISPANVLADFTEATFGGYAGQSMSGDFGSPSKIQDGEYQINSSTKTFSCTGSPDNVVLGMYLDNGSDVLFASLFDGPVSFTTGTNLSFATSPQDWSLSIL